MGKEELVLRPESRDGSGEGRQALWAFRDLLRGAEAEAVLSEVCRRGRMERWGHAAEVPLWMDPVEVALVVEGTVMASLPQQDGVARLSRGDVFGKATDVEVAKVLTDRETTICVIPQEELREALSPHGVRRQVEVGRWRSKTPLEVTPWPLLGTSPPVRLARLLLYLVESYGEIEADKGLLPVSPSPSQLAELAGIRKKRLNRVWRLFASSGLVDRTRQGLMLTDLRRLRQLAAG